MSKVLILNANSKAKEYSRTWKITEEFLKVYKQENATDELKEIDLFNYDYPDLDTNVMAALGILMSGGKVEDLDKVAQEKMDKRRGVLEEFKSADKIVLSTPMWEFTNPSVVKKWLDAIVVANETFKYTENGPVGLVEGKKVLFIQSTGGDYTDAEERNYGLNYFRTIMGFVGINDFTSITAYGMDSGLQDTNLPIAIKRANEIAKEF